MCCFNNRRCNCNRCGCGSNNGCCGSNNGGCGASNGGCGSCSNGGCGSWNNGGCGWNSCCRRCGGSNNRENYNVAYRSGFNTGYDIGFHDGLRAATPMPIYENQTGCGREAAYGATASGCGNTAAAGNGCSARWNGVNGSYAEAAVTSRGCEASAGPVWEGCGCSSR